MNEMKKDCFAYVKGMNGEGRCLLLTKEFCKEEECKFYKKNGSLCDSCIQDRPHECGKCQEARANLEEAKRRAERLH